jgi:hypothetical protein
MLAYLFWHRPRRGGAPHPNGVVREEYERALLAFHRSLARTPPVGSLGSAAFRLARAPWSEQDEPLYEDWYLVEDFAALGVLNQAAVGRGHRTPHDAAARRSGFGAGGLYQLLEGGGGLEAELAVWVSRAPDTRELELGELLADGMDPTRASLWQRQLVLGPAPEFCLLTQEPPAGAAATRLPSGWSARALPRAPLPMAG